MREKLPTIIEGFIKIDHPNQSIVIHEGTITLKNDSMAFDINGEIYFSWFPKLAVYFEGSNDTEAQRIWNKTLEHRFTNFELHADSINWQDCKITDFDFFSSAEQVISIIGECDRFYVGDITVPVNKVIFSLPNFRKFHGAKTRLIRSNGVHFSRIQFSADKFEIKLDRKYNPPSYTDDEHKRLKRTGGYSITYGGEISSLVNNPVQLDDIDNLRAPLNTFLSFINGLRTSIMFIQAKHNSELLWTDYSAHEVAMYNFRHSWSYFELWYCFEELWNKYYMLWKDNNDEFLSTTIHWYLEANKPSNSPKGAIIMAQAALEFIYNWWVIENIGLIHGDDAKNISASNKIRLILSQLRHPYNIPDGLTNLISYNQSLDQPLDGVEMIVRIRNRLVHSKIGDNATLSEEIIEEALTLMIHYIELSLLAILNYDYKYHSRCSGQYEMVPWIEGDEEE